MAQHTDFNAANHTDIEAVDFMVCPGCGGIAFRLENGSTIEVRISPDQAIELAHLLIIHDFMSNLDDNDGEDEPEPKTPIKPMREMVLVD